MSKTPRIPSPDYQIPTAWLRSSALRCRIEQALPVYALNLVLVRMMTKGTPNVRERGVYGSALDAVIAATAVPWRGLSPSMADKGREIAITVGKLALNRQVSDATLPALLGVCAWMAPLIGKAPHLELSANPALSVALKIICAEAEHVARAEAGSERGDAYAWAADLGAAFAPVIEARIAALGLYQFATQAAQEAA